MEGGAWRRVLRHFLVTAILGLEVGAFTRQHQYHLLFRKSETGRGKAWIITGGHHPPRV